MPGDKSRQNGKLGGRPKGRKNDATLDKSAAREAFRTFLQPYVEDMHRSQVANAKGLKYLVARDKTGKFQRLTEAQANERIGAGDSTIEVWEKDPAIQAYTDLMNRYMDKPVEQVQHTGEDGGPIEHVFRWRG